MKIERTVATPLNVHCDVAIAGAKAGTNLSCVVVRIDTDSGPIGCGFTAITEEEAVACVINEVAAPVLVGLDPRRTEQIWTGCTGSSRHGAKAATRRMQSPLWTWRCGTSRLRLPASPFGACWAARGHRAGLCHIRLWLPGPRRIATGRL